MTIVFCLPGSSFSGPFLKRWTLLYRFCLQNNIVPILSQQYSNNIYFARNLSLGGDVKRGRKQKPFNGEVNYDYIMWIDSDIIFEPGHFTALINHQMDIVSGIYLMNSGKEFATAKAWDEEYFKKNGVFRFLTPEDVLGKPDLVEVAYTGMGFMLVKKGVFEAMEYPWFEPRRHEIGEMVDYSSEDVSFCLKARDKKFRVYVDPKVRVGHEKKTVYI